jgi:hypothetical protein
MCATRQHKINTLMELWPFCRPVIAVLCVAKWRADTVCMSRDSVSHRHLVQYRPSLFNTRAVSWKRSATLHHKLFITAEYPLNPWYGLNFSPSYTLNPTRHSIALQTTGRPTEGCENWLSSLLPHHSLPTAGHFSANILLRSNCSTLLIRKGTVVKIPLLEVGLCRL